MGSEQEAVVRSLHKDYGARDRAAVLDYYADDAIWHMWWWREPLVGREAIKADLDRQFDGMSDYRSEIVNMVSADAIVFVEGIDAFTPVGGKETTLHWASVMEINAEGRIAQRRDYQDFREIETQQS